MAKFTEEYQVVDSHGNPVGPVQKFEAETETELIQKLKVAHQNASARYYEVNRQNRLEGALTPDPDEPIRTFDEKPLSADELVHVNTLLKDPRTTADAHKILLESTFGGPVEDVRQLLRDREIAKRVDFIKGQVAEFMADHPEYPGSERDRESIQKYLLKNKLAFTKKNFEIAFRQLVDDGIIILAPKTEPVTVPAAVTVPATPSPETIPPAATPEGENTPPSDEVVRPRVSSSGLSRESSSAAPAGTPAPKVLEITRQQVTRMSAKEYSERMQDKDFAAAIAKLYPDKK